MSENNKTVVIIGASNKKERFSYQAFQLLIQQQTTVIPVHPKLGMIDDTQVINELSEINQTVDTVTLYISPDRSDDLADKILALHPRRVIFNPGTESEALQQKLENANIECIKDCTIKMLESNRF